MGWDSGRLSDLPHTQLQDKCNSGTLLQASGTTPGLSLSFCEMGMRSPLADREGVGMQ